MTSEQANVFWMLNLEQAMDNNVTEIKSEMRGNLKAVGIRIGRELDEIYEELRKKDKKTLKRVIEEFRFEDFCQMAMELSREDSGAPKDSEDRPRNDPRRPEKASEA